MEARYVVISPMKDEERFIDFTLKSMVSQTLKPALWIIVDDGSTDASQEIARWYADRYGFIRILNTDRTAARQPGGAVVQAFNRGFASVAAESYDFIVKLDCDLSLPPDYFQKLIGRFAADERLGIASGIYLEADGGDRWRPIAMPSYHAFGASKVIRRQCFEDIGGFVAARGWDTVDEIRAMSRGWKTGHFPDLQTRHHKPEGTGIGVLNTSRMHGEIYYMTGGDPLFFLFKALRRIVTPPRPLNALALIQGYVGALAKRKPRLVTSSEARCYRSVLRQRLFGFNKPAAVTE
jgi:glycosyltransferase involved in cell wall biosynthesis